MATIVAGLLATFVAGALLAGAGSPANAGTTIGIEYKNANKSGEVYIKTVTQNGFTCTSSRTNRDAGTSNLTGAANNSISSFTNFSNCFTRHWENSNYGGANLGFRDGGNITGAMNDKTSSLEWS